VKVSEAMKRMQERVWNLLF